MNILIKTIFFIFILTQHVFADEASNWLKKEIDEILNAYQNTNLSNEDKFLIIEETINFNFAGAGIAKFVAGDSWNNADKKTKKEYIFLFKRHLALNIASMMQGYSDQEYILTNFKFDSKNKVSLINMEILNSSGNILVTWRVKESKNRFYVIDLLVADISLVVTKRSEFNSMLKTANYNLKELNSLLKIKNQKNYLKIIN